MFITTNSSSNRSVHPIKEIIRKQIKIDKLVELSFYGGNYPLDIMQWRSEINALTIECNLNDSIDFIIDQQDSLRAFIHKDHVVLIDMTAIPKPHLFRLIKFLKTILEVHELIVLYTEPKYYYFETGLHDSYKYYDGQLSPSPMPDFEGEHLLEDRKQLLLLFMGFEGNVSKRIYDHINPNELILINGFPSYYQKYKDISYTCNANILAIKSVLEAKYVCSYNPYETYNLLEDICRRYIDEYAITIACLSTKPISLGVCLYCLNNPKIRTIYPNPSKYAKIKMNLIIYGYIIFEYSNMEFNLSATIMLPTTLII